MRIAMSFKYMRACVLIAGMLASGCADANEPKTPVDTFKTYITAAKKKDTTRMKLLLSDEWIKMHEEQSKALKVTLELELIKQTT